MVCQESQQLVELLAERETKVAWPVQRRVGVFIVHQERDAELAGKAAEQIKKWLVEKTELGPLQVFRRSDEEARQLRSIESEEATDQLGANFPVLTQETDCVLLLQSPGVLREPKSVGAMCAAVAYEVPICCANFTGDQPELVYNFEEAFDTLSSFSSAFADKGGGLDAVEELRELTGISDLDTIGKQLLDVLPKIISRPVSLTELAANGKLKDSEMIDLQSTLRGTATLMQTGAGAAEADADGQPVLRRRRSIGSSRTTIPKSKSAPGLQAGSLAAALNDNGEPVAETTAARDVLMAALVARHITRPASRFG